MSIHLTPTKKRQLADFLTSHSPKKPHLEPPPLDIIKISYFPSMRKLKIIDSEEADRIVHIVHRVSGQQHRFGIIGSTGLCQDRSCTPVTHFVKNRKGEFEISVYHINIVPALIGRCLSAEVAALRLFCRNAITPNGPVRLEWVGPEPDLHAIDHFINLDFIIVQTAGDGATEGDLRLIGDTAFVHIFANGQLRDLGWDNKKVLQVWTWVLSHAQISSARHPYEGSILAALDAVEQLVLGNAPNANIRPNISSNIMPTI